MVINRTAPVFLSSHGSTHAEDLIRSIGHADLIAGTPTEQKERREKERKTDLRDNRGSIGVLISNSRDAGTPTIETTSPSTYSFIPE